MSHNPDVIGLHESVAGLDPELQEVVDTLYFQGCTQSEAAEELELPLGTVKTRARRALTQLRSLMGDGNGAEENGT